MSAQNRSAVHSGTTQSESAQVMREGGDRPVLGATTFSLTSHRLRGFGKPMLGGEWGHDGYYAVRTPPPGMGQTENHPPSLRCPWSPRRPGDPLVQGTPPGIVGTGVGRLGYIYLGPQTDPEPENGLFCAMSRKDRHSCRFLETRTAGGRRERVKVLTLPPPGTCLILSFEPHLDWTLLRSSFLLIICTFDSQKKG